MSREKLLDAYHRFIEATTEEENSAAMQDICKAAHFVRVKTNKNNVDEQELYEYMDFESNAKSNSRKIIDGTYGEVSDMIYVMAILKLALPLVNAREKPTKFYDEFEKMSHVNGLGEYHYRMHCATDMLKYPNG